MEQKPFAVAEYDIDYNLFTQFHRFNTRLNSSLMGYIVPPLGFMVSLATGITFGFDWLTIALLVICSLLILSKVSSYYWTPKRLFTKSRAVYAVPHRLTLYEQVFENAREGSDSRSVNKYTELWRAYETKDLFYLYLSSQQVFLLPKKALSPEASQKLRAILAKQLGKKFHTLSR